LGKRVWIIRGGEQETVRREQETLGREQKTVGREQETVGWEQKTVGRGQETVRTMKAADRQERESKKQLGQRVYDHKSGRVENESSGSTPECFVITAIKM
jgi:hypothetical protein